MTGSVIEVNLDNLVSNLNIIKKNIRPGCKIMGVVKASAYGHGALHVARVLLEEGVYMLAVASVYEGASLRKAGICSPILVFSEPSMSSTHIAFKYGLTITVHSFDFLEFLSVEARRLKKTCRIHLKVDTGMGRLGFAHTEILKAVNSVLKSHTSPFPLILEGIYTHFANADIPKDRFTEKQISILEKITKEIKANGVYVPLIHAANSAAIFNYRESHLDIVRPGIALYGASPCPDNPLTAGLKELITWKTELVQLKWVPDATSIGYGCAYVTKKKTLVGTVRVGYADGFNRLLSNVGFVIVRGVSVPVIGTVCMDFCLVDLSSIPDVKLDEDVLLLGSEGRKTITASYLADLCGTIPYEVFCSIGRRSIFLYRKNGKFFDVENRERIVKK